MVAVVPEARGQGLSGKLIAHALADAANAAASRRARWWPRSSAGRSTPGSGYRPLGVSRCGSARAESAERLGLAEVEALGEVDAHLAQQLERLAVVDELGDRALAQPAGDVDDRPHDQLVGPVVGRSRDELAVDLQQVERQVLEVVERGEAGAEVVERELAAELADRRWRSAGRGRCSRSRRSPSTSKQRPLPSRAVRGERAAMRSGSSGSAPTWRTGSRDSATSRPAACSSARISTARATTQRSISWTRSKRSAT